MAQCLKYHPIVLRTEFFELDGINSLNDCAVLSQLIYWASICNFKEFYKTDEELSEETRIPFSAIRRIKERIKNISCIEIIVRGIPAKSFYKINPHKILEEISSPYIEQCLQKPQKTQNAQNEQTRMRKTDKQECAKQINKNAQNEQTIYRTEITSENTTEISLGEDDVHHETSLVQKHLEIKQNNQSAIFQKMKEIWRQHISSKNEKIPELDCQDHALTVLSQIFLEDLSKWHEYCEEIAKSSYLMGKKPDKNGVYWKLNSRWALKREKIQDVLSGKYIDYQDINIASTEASLVKIAIPSFEDMICNNTGGVDLQVKQILARVMAHQPEKYYAWVYSNNANFDVKGDRITVEGVSTFCAESIEREVLSRYSDDLKAMTGMSRGEGIAETESEVVKAQKPDVKSKPLTPEQRAEFSLGFEQLCQELDPENDIKRVTPSFISRELPMANLMSRVVKNIPSAAFIIAKDQQQERKWM